IAGLASRARRSGAGKAGLETSPLAVRPEHAVRCDLPHQSMPAACCAAPGSTCAVMGSVTFLDFPLIDVKCLPVEPSGFALDESWRAMAATYTCTALRRATGMLFVAGALAFAAAATVLSATFDWPDILREPAGVVLP